MTSQVFTGLSNTSHLGQREEMKKGILLKPLTAFPDMFKNKTLLITGGTGSFGNTVLKRLLKTEIRQIRIFSRDEKKQDEMRKRLNSDLVKFYIGDVRSRSSVDTAMRGVDFVFHAAALKQVPSCEFYPMEAVRTNIIGTENVLESAINNAVKKVIVLSTDKAVYPINAMGLSKAMMERVMVAKSRLADPNGTVFCGTRYGNVMASRGSVIPLFVHQIKSGLPLTITNADMTRFMMSLDDAVELVMYAFRHGKQGDIFVQKSPAATIGLLTEVLLEIFEANNPVQTIGTRHGEKMHETLFTREEWAHSEELEKYFRIIVDDRDLNYGKYFSEGQKESGKADYTSENTHRLDREELRELLLSLDSIKRQLGERDSLKC